MSVLTDDTTAATLSWLFDTLADEQEWQDKLRKAIWEFKAEKEQPTLDDYEGFAMLNAVLREGIRHQVTVPYLTRVCAEDDVIPLTHPIKGKDGKEITAIPISKRTRVDVGLGDYNHSTYIWGDDALEFKPERWLRPGGPVMPGVEEVPGHWCVAVVPARRAYLIVSHRNHLIVRTRSLRPCIC